MKLKWLIQSDVKRERVCIKTIDDTLVDLKRVTLVLKSIERSRSGHSMVDTITGLYTGKCINGKHNEYSVYGRSLKITVRLLTIFQRGYGTCLRMRQIERVPARFL